MVKITNVLFKLIEQSLVTAMHIIMWANTNCMHVEYATRMEGLCLQSEIKSLFTNAPV